MAGTVTVTEEIDGTIKKIKWSWLSDAGNADQITINAFSGKILGLCTVPDGVAAPTVGYDVEVQDQDGIDVLMGGGANRHNLNTEYVLSTSLGAVAKDKLNLIITDAGNAKKGTVYLFIR